MKKLNLEEKMKIILTGETATVRQLALQVIEKPVPKVWMIFIPIFFVFYFWKLKQYESGLKDFAEHHLVPRRRTLEAVLEALKNKRPVDFNHLAHMNGSAGKEARSLCIEWLTLLGGHFQLLFEAHGNSYDALIRSGYQSRTDYQLFCNRLGKAETAYYLALLPEIEGDTAVLKQVTEKMAESISALRRQEAMKIFS